MKNKIFRILCVIMLCCISLVFVGCMGNPPDNYEDEDYNPVEDNEGGISIDLYGTKAELKNKKMIIMGNMPIT